MLRKLVSIVSMCFIIASCVRTSTEVRVYLNENQCLYSYSNLSALNDLPPDVDLVFYAEKYSFGTWKELFKQLNLTKPHSFEPLAKAEAELRFEFFKNGEQLFSGGLDALPLGISNMAIANGQLAAYDSIPLDGFTLSERNEIDIQDQKIVFCDYFLNSAHIVDYQTKVIQKIAGADFDTEPFLAKIDYDREEYEKILPELRKYSYDKAKIASVYYRNDTISVVSTLSVPKEEDNREVLTPRFFIGDYFGGQWVNLYFASIPIVGEGKVYGIFNKVYANGKDFITNLVTRDLEAENHLWARFTPEDNRLSVSVLSPKNPKISIKQGNQPGLMGIHNDWFFLWYFPMAYNAKTGEKIDYTECLKVLNFKLPVDLSNSKLMVIDFYHKHNVSTVIYINQDKHYVARFNESGNEVFLDRELNLPKNIMPRTLRIISDIEFSALSNTRKSIFKLRFN